MKLNDSSKVGDIVTLDDFSHNEYYRVLDRDGVCGGAALKRIVTAEAKRELADIADRKRLSQLCRFPILYPPMPSRHATRPVWI